MGEQTEYKYDLFVSHSPADREWVRGYLLPAMGLPSDRVLTRDDFQPGASLVGEFDRAVTSSRYTVLVLSPAYLADEWATFSDHLASYASASERRDRLIPLIVQPCVLPLHIDFRVRLDCTDPDHWESEITRLRALLDRPEPAKESLPCPYPGMVPFSEANANRFYGREDQVDELRRRLRHTSFLIVIGPSGSGKSSLVLAGLAPELHQHQPGEWLVKIMRPGPAPLAALAKATGDVIDLKTFRPSNLESRRLLLVIDQFEELFTQTPKPEQSAFIAALKSLSQDTLQRVRQVESCALVLVMRADFYPDLMNSDLWPVDASQRLEIAPLRGEALRRAIQQPAADVGGYIEPGLLERLLADASDEPGVLPLLQETLVLLWENRKRRLLPLSAYERLGSAGRSGLAVAMATKADATLASLSPDQQALARRIFLRLVQFGEGRADTRRQQPITALRAVSDDPLLFDQTLRHLADNRLLTLSGEETATDRKADISHEALIGGWPRLRQWIDEARSGLLVHRRLGEAATEWNKNRRDPSYLHSGARLREADKFARAHPDDLNQPEHDFLQASLSARRRGRLQRMVLGSVVVLLVAVVAVALWSGPLALRLSWTPVPDLATVQVTNLEQASDGALYAGLYSGPSGPTIACLARSRNDGLTWERLNLQCKAVYSLLPDPDQPDVLYVSLGAQGLYRSADGGNSWNKIGERLPMKTVDALAKSPTGALYAGDVRLPLGVYASADQGQTWLPVQGSPPAPVQFLRWTDNRLLAGTTAGLWQWTPDGQWTRLITPTIVSLVSVPGALVAGGAGIFELRNGAAPRQVSEREITSLDVIVEQVPRFVASTSKSEVLAWRLGDAQVSTLVSSTNLGSPYGYVIRVRPSPPLHFLMGTGKGLYQGEMQRQFEIGRR